MGNVPLGALLQWTARPIHFKCRPRIAFTLALSPIDIIYRLLKNLEIVVFKDVWIEELFKFTDCSIWFDIFAHAFDIFILLRHSDRELGILSLSAFHFNFILLTWFLFIYFTYFSVALNVIMLFNVLGYLHLTINLAFDVYDETKIL